MAYSAHRLDCKHITIDKMGYSCSEKTFIDCTNCELYQEEKVGIGYEYGILINGEFVKEIVVEDDRVEALEEELRKYKRKADILQNTLTKIRELVSELNRL